MVGLMAAWWYGWWKLGVQFALYNSSSTSRWQHAPIGQRLVFVPAVPAAECQAIACVRCDLLQMQMHK
jgi:hypothetical protein